jgi:hypothetical protein
MSADSDCELQVVLGQQKYQLGYIFSRAWADNYCGDLGFIDDEA